MGLRQSHPNYNVMWKFPTIRASQQFVERRGNVIAERLSWHYMDSNMLDALAVVNTLIGAPYLPPSIQHPRDWKVTANELPTYSRLQLELPTASFRARQQALNVVQMDVVLYRTLASNMHRRALPEIDLADEHLEYLIWKRLYCTTDRQITSRLITMISRAMVKFDINDPLQITSEHLKAIHRKTKRSVEELEAVRRAANL